MDTKYVYGPDECYFLIHPQQLQRVLLFGETHGNYEEKCVDLPGEEVVSFVKDLTNKYYLLDLFLELPVFGTVYEGKLPRFSGTSDAISNFNKLFQGCRGDVYRRCHYIDIRRHPFNARIISMWYFLKRIVDRLKGNSSYLTQISQENLRKYEDRLTAFSYEEDYMKWQLKIPQIIEKEFKGFNPIFGENIREKLAQYIEENFTRDFGKQKEIIKELASDFKILEEKPLSEWDKDSFINFFDIFKYHIGKLLFSEAKHLDVYALVRMFHQYTEQPHYASNIIFYGGHRHTHNIYSFFYSIGYFDMSPNDLNMKQCVEVPSKYLLCHYFYHSGKTFIISRKESDGRASNLLQFHLSGKINLTETKRHFYRAVEEKDTIILAADPFCFYLGGELLASRNIQHKIILLQPDIVVIPPAEVSSFKERYITYITKEKGGLFLLGFIQKEIPILVTEEDRSIVFRLYPDRRVLVFNGV